MKRSFLPFTNTPFYMSWPLALGLSTLLILKTCSKGLVLSQTTDASTRSLTAASNSDSSLAKKALSAESQEYPIALVATSTKKRGELVQWCNRNKLYLKGRIYIASPETVDLLQYNPDTENLMRFTDLPEATFSKVTELANRDDDDDDNDAALSFDLFLATKIVQNQVSKVICFADEAPQTLLEACAVSNTPIALNSATADALIQSSATTHRTAYLFYNPMAGSGSHVEDTLQTVYNALEPQIPITAIPTDPKKGITKQVEELVEQLQTRPSSSPVTPIILACGGDGTVSEVAAGVMGSGIPFGVIPGGTANAFASALGIPSELEGACDVIMRGNTRLVDGASCNGDKNMILLAGVGFEANMVDHADKTVVKKIFGPLAYILGGAKEVVQGENFGCHLVVDGQRIPFDDNKKNQKLSAQAVTVAVVAPPTSIMAQGTGEVIPDDGLLDVTVQTSETMAERLDAMAHLLGAALVHRPTEAETVLRFRARDVELYTNSKHKIVVDGEVLPAAKKFSFSILPKALNVVVPPTEAKRDE